MRSLEEHRRSTGGITWSFALRVESSHALHPRAVRFGVFLWQLLNRAAHNGRKTTVLQCLESFTVLVFIVSVFQLPLSKKNRLYVKVKHIMSTE